MVLVHGVEKMFYIDGYLKNNLDIMKKNLKKDFDVFIVVDGRERFGKSTLAAQIAIYMDPTYNLDRCVFTPEQFHEAIENSKQYQAVVFDEAHGYLNSRSSMSKFNKQLVQIMTEMGSRNLVVIIVLPNFFELDKYPAIFRSTCLLHVHDRAKFCFYSYKKKKDLYLRGKKFYSYNVSANFFGSFIKYFPLDKIAYETKKRSSIMPETRINYREKKWKTQRDKLIDFYKGNGFTQEQISNVIGINQSKISAISLGKQGLAHPKPSHTL